MILAKIPLSGVRGSERPHPGLMLWSAMGWKVPLITALVLGLYGRVMVDWAGYWWEDEGYSHGLLVAPLALYLMWKQWRSVPKEAAAPDSRGLVAMGVACLAYLLGTLGAEFFLSRSSFVLMTAALIWTFRGTAYLRRVAFPLLLIASVIPLPVIVYNSMTAPLQLLASSTATQFIQLLGVSVYREGNIIQLANTSLGVAEACSGLRSLASLSVAALLLGYLECTRLRTRTVVFLMAVPIAILFNVLRVAGTALLAERDPDLALGFYHSLTGWLVFVCGFGTLWAGVWLSKRIFDSNRKSGV
jgi:exosortase